MAGQNVKGLMLVNLGTPDSPDSSGLRRYLNQFLTDRRVIDLPAFFRHLLFKGIVVPIRAPKVAKLYKELWIEEGSPLKVYGQKVTDQVQEILGEEYNVKLAMRYQNPSMESVINEFYEEGVSEIIMFPMFPQYASATTGSIYEELMRILNKREQIPNLRFINSYYDYEPMIDIYADNARSFNFEDYDHFVFSFHGVPERYLKKENSHCQCNVECCSSISKANQFCYSAQCHSTAHAIATKLGLNKEDYTIAYQSRFGPEKWVQPYTDEVLFDLLDNGKKKVLVFSPAFVADCLETTIEIGFEYKEEFIEKGGEKLDLVPSLNDDPRWVKVIADLVLA